MFPEWPLDGLEGHSALWKASRNNDRGIVDLLLTHPTLDIAVSELNELLLVMSGQNTIEIIDASTCFCPGGGSNTYYKLSIHIHIHIHVHIYALLYMH
jgi:hypothetical protein